MRKLLFIFLLLLALPACQTMDPPIGDITGEYKLTGLSDRKTSYFQQLPEEERQAIQSARVTRGRQAGSWFFEYTLPFQTSTTKFSYIQISQEIIWEPAYGRFYFAELSETELQPTRFTPNQVELQVEDGKITFRYLPTNLLCTWTKQ